MQTKVNHYLIRLQFLGFRYSGWQKQPGQRTIEGMLVKTLKFILPNQGVKVLGTGRTDAKVSALDYAFELFVKGRPLTDLPAFMHAFNANLPADIKVTGLEEIEGEFNIIQSIKVKEYIYLFSFGTKNHPYAAPFMANIMEQLDIESMKKAALLFKGTHNFSAYTARPRDNATFVREVLECDIQDNQLVTASFFPKESYLLKIKAVGFLRYQVRMIMGGLISLGKGEIKFEDIEESLRENTNFQVTYVAPGSGLHLNTLEFDRYQ